jgi:hypothetical protein
MALFATLTRLRHKMNVSISTRFYHEKNGGKYLNVAAGLGA